MQDLQDRRFVLGITGGIAAYKAAELTRLLVKQGAEVDVVLTRAGGRFVTSVTFQALSGRPVWEDIWDARMANNMAHIDLSRGAAAIVVAPASADFMAKVATGMADDLLTTLCLARECPLLVAPAMNRQMWEKPATQRNARTLAEDGAVLLGPSSGDQACRETGMGRMLEPEELLEDIVAYFQPKVLAGRHVMLTAGPTFEPIDPVRGITNSSSGKMGFALARACAEAGAAVTLIAGPSAQATPRGVTRVDVQTAREMEAEVMSRIAGQEVFIGVAAVADYRPAARSQQKMKKGSRNLILELEPNPDILAQVAGLENPPFCVGFAAESEKLEEYAEGKRNAKRLPLLVGNLVQHGLGGDENHVVLFDERGRHPLMPGPKLRVAREIVGHLARMI